VARFLLIANQLPPPADRYRYSWANPGTAENSVGRSLPARRRWLRSDLSATASPSPGSFGVPAACGWTEIFRFRWKTSAGRSTRPGRRSASIRSSGIGILESKKTCSSSRETESSRRWLARIGFPDAGRKKKCLPPPRPRGRMMLRRLADGRPAAQRPQTTATHEPNDAREAGGDGVRNGKISGPRPGGRNRYILETEWRLECGR
jgi:hypothetical protein